LREADAYAHAHTGNAAAMLPAAGVGAVITMPQTIAEKLCSRHDLHGATLAACVSSADRGDPQRGGGCRSTLTSDINEKRRGHKIESASVPRVHMARARNAGSMIRDPRPEQGLSRQRCACLG
jgi:hypothetical protein